MKSMILNTYIDENRNEFGIWSEKYKNDFELMLDLAYTKLKLMGMPDVYKSLSRQQIADCAWDAFHKVSATLRNDVICFWDQVSNECLNLMVRLNNI